VTRFGAVLDSTADRIGEGVTLVALTVFLADDGGPTAMAGAGLALVASNLTSYVKARAEVLGATCDAGLATRTERVLILGFGLVAHLPVVAVWLVAIAASVTVGQRLWEAQRALR
jgi:CDP-diacylglycerol--glycerol-3-phosphate 3-phosphatidyltransferase